MKSPRELLINKYSHRKKDIDEIVPKLQLLWRSEKQSGNNKEITILNTIFNWRSYWYGLGFTWIVIGFLHSVTPSHVPIDSAEHTREMQNQWQFMLQKHTALYQEGIEWLEPLNPDQQQSSGRTLPPTHRVPGPQGKIRFRHHQSQVPV